MTITLSINCVLSYIEESSNGLSLYFVAEEAKDVEKLTKHKIAYNNQFKVKLNKKSTSADNFKTLIGQHMCIEVKCIKYKFTNKESSTTTVTYEGNRLVLVGIKNLKV